MASTRAVLQQINKNLDESLGERTTQPKARLQSIVRDRDVGRRPVRNVGTVEVDRVMPDPEQPRKQFEDDALQRLAASLKRHGQLQPIQVRWSEYQRKWVIVSGERRWRAAQRAGLPTVLCSFQDDDVSRPEIREQQIVENLLREDLKPVEQARAFDELMKENHWNGKQLAAALAIPASTVSRSLALLRLPLAIQQQVDAGAVSARSAYELSKIDDAAAQTKLAAQAAEGGVTHSELAIHNTKRTKPARSHSIRLRFLCEDGWAVSVTRQGPSSYAALEQALAEVLEEVRTRIRNNIRLGSG